MLKQLKARLAELEDDEQRGAAEEVAYPGQQTRAEEIATLRGQIAAYERLAKLARRE
jgi:hypothetical protein